MALSQLEAENARLTRSAAQQSVAATAPQLGIPVDHISNSLSGPHLGRVSSTSEERVTRAALSACRLGRAVIGTVASPSYAQPLLALAASARNVGFRCVTVSPYSHFDALKDPRIRRLGDPRRPLLPEPEFCSNITASTLLPNLDKKKSTRFHPASQYYGWRRSHLYRTWMWYVVVSHNYDLLAVDLDWRFISNPLPSLYSAKQPGGSAAAVVASHDEVPTASLLAKRIRSPPRLRDVMPGLHEASTSRYSTPFLNVGLMFVRSGGQTTVLAEQVMQRTLHAWEQGIFNEELNWGVGANLSCCHAPHGHSFDPLLKHFRKDVSTHAIKGTVLEKQPDEFEAGCDTLQPSVSPFHWEAPLPPTTSPLHWQQVHGRTQQNSTTGWSKHRFNTLVLRGLGRCTELYNVCERGQRTESPASPTAPLAAPRAAPPTAPPAAPLLLGPRAPVSGNGRTWPEVNSGDKAKDEMLISTTQSSQPPASPPSPAPPYSCRADAFEQGAWLPSSRESYFGDWTCPLWEKPINARFNCAEFPFRIWKAPFCTAPDAHDVFAAHGGHRTIFFVGDSLMNQMQVAVACRVLRDAHRRHSTPHLASHGQLMPGHPECNSSAVSCLGVPRWEGLVTRSDLPNDRAACRPYCSTVSIFQWSVTLCFVAAGTNFPQCSQPADDMALTLYERRLVRRGDVVVFNEGLWHNNKTRTNENLRSILDDLKKGHAIRTALADRGVGLVWREVSPQHFASPDGSFPNGQLAWYAGQRCAPLESVSLHEARRSALLSSLESEGLPVIRIWNLTRSQWDVHLERRTKHVQKKGAADCTHFCEPSGVMEAWADGALLAFERILHTLVSPWRR